MTFEEIGVETQVIRMDLLVDAYGKQGFRLAAYADARTLPSSTIGRQDAGKHDVSSRAHPPLGSLGERLA